MRVTVDLDSPSLFQITKIWMRARNHLPDGNQRGRVSSSGRGIHIKVVGLDIDETEARHFRRCLSDDPMRIELDIRRGYRPNQVLFSKKEKREAGPWVDSLESLLRNYQEATGYTF